MNEEIIRVENLSVIIKDRFLIKNAYLSIKKGECWGILGEDKSGKTSMIKAISGSLPINPGQVFILGEDIYYNKKVLKSVSTVFDPPVFFKYQTVYDNLRYISSLSESNNKEKILKMLNKFGIAHRLNTKVMFLPYYQKKLMALALGFLTEPKILLLDEPFRNLPADSMLQVKNAIREARENGTTVIITTNYFEMIEDECDNFIFMEGRAIKKELSLEDCQNLSSTRTYAFVKVKYPHYVGKLIYDNFELRVKISGKRVLFEADEDTVASIVKFLTKKNLAVYNAGYINKKMEKIFANLTPYYKEDKSE